MQLGATETQNDESWLVHFLGGKVGYPRNNLITDGGKSGIPVVAVVAGRIHGEGGSMFAFFWN